ncbi:glycosyltransferase [Paenibacillus polymyxa]|uniref:glycosyltransferase n=1 Tax=Paenibacillus polymyxa TaxID=1406 RepID=UPI002AB47B2E|nr:glycosyltransferase [Paenibacillus polymyxa]MDY7991543.1 glycosyltransferase [Paenibacillus polymyxa]MDY8117984.1 glycosyltransferase [Paenibacillus polymyxa]
MEENKVCFIIIYNNEFLCEECISYINSLSKPDGFEVEIIPIYSTENVASVYNKAMKQSSAKYKVYLKQDSFIINKTFMEECLGIFKRNHKIGMIGVIGAESLPPSCFWEDANDEKKYGSLYCYNQNGVDIATGANNRNVSGEINHDCVQVIDGRIMITQYDLIWRDDLFSNSYYDIAQCFEFSDAGYSVAVPRQHKPWIISDSESEDRKCPEGRKVFLKHYGTKFLPKVSVLIPAYNRPFYLELALQSALYQSYQNIEIIIGDDSTNNEVEKAIEPYLLEYNNVSYYKNETNLGLENWYKIYDMANGEYINFLMDDDLFHFEKIEKMVNKLHSHDDVSLVTSFRELIDESGEVLSSKPSTRLFFQENTIINGKTFGSFMLSQTWNIIGEPTTAMFRKKDVKRFGFYHEHKFNVINDFATWLSLMEKGDVVYLTEPLSYFRQHSGQNQANPKYKVLGIDEWLCIINEARKNGFFENDLTFKETIINYIKSSLDIIFFYQKLKLDETLEVYLVKEKLVSALDELLVK